MASLFAMTMAAQVQAVAVGWLIYQATRDPLALGLIGLAEVVPYVSVALFAGWIVDRADRRSISIRAMAILLLSAIILAAYQWWNTDATRVWPYYTVIGITGIARSFLQTARSALVAELVPREDFANAATWRSSTWQLATVVGPALGGLGLAAVGAQMTLLANVVIVAAAVAAMVAIRHTPTVLATAGASMLRTLAEGIRFVRRERVILSALTLDMLAVFFGGAVALLPAFATDILKVGPAGLGLLNAAPGAGAVVMAIIIAHRPPFERAGRVLLTAVAVFGLAMAAFALSRHFVLSLAMLFISGAADNISAVIRSTMIQVLVPPQMLGRVSAINAIFIGSSNELGAFESGVAARLLGVAPSVLFGSTMTLLVVSVMGWRVRELRDLRRIERISL